MITNEDIKKIMDDCLESGYDVKVRDISFTLLTFFFDDSKVAYKSLWPDSDADDSEVGDYSRSESVSFLKSYLRTNYVGKPSSKKGKGAKAPAIDESVAMSFEDNKSAMIKLIDDTQKAMDSGEVDKKDGLKIIADLRVKLNDKFSVKDEIKDSVVVVENKFNSICPYIGKECYVDKEWVKRKFNLTEK